ncbi:hypothetical protein ON010_g15918 [Phytophthora cinnamomi]|nr:hypothetical protein ON010_g15918 [Phytophthora cinnamomi]
MNADAGLGLKAGVSGISVKADTGLKEDADAGLGAKASIDGVGGKVGVAGVDVKAAADLGVKAGLGVADVKVDAGVSAGANVGVGVGGKVDTGVGVKAGVGGVAIKADADLRVKAGVGGVDAKAGAAVGANIGGTGVKAGADAGVNVGIGGVKPNTDGKTGGGYSNGVSPALPRAHQGPPEGVFSGFEGRKLVSTFKAPKTLHGAIYLGEREGGIAWSHDEKTIAYVAEKKVAESPAFWENVNSKKEKEKKENDEAANPLPGAKFEFEDDWGEQYEGKKTASIFLATLATGKIEEVKGVPANLTCADVAFVPGDHELVFAATETDMPKRLGIIYCYNRPIALYHVVLNKEDQSKNVVKKLDFVPQDEESKEIGTMRNPRFSPDGKQLAFLATRDIATHGTCSFLCVADWASKQTSTVIPIKDEPDATVLDVTKAFNGLFTGSLSENAWSPDGKYIYVVSQVGSRQVWKYVEVATKRLVSPEYVEGLGVAVETVVDRKGDYFLVMVSSPTRPASVFLVHIDAATGKHVKLPISIEDQQGATNYIKRWEVYSIPASVSDIPAAEKKLPETPAVLKDLLIPSVSSSSDFEATVMLPSSAPPADGYPVILELHGGPHGNSPVMYRNMCDFWAALGFAIVTVNYRGSTGFGIKALESLIGKVGTQDVYDCHYALCYLLEKSSRLGLSLDKSRVHCSGGSHGGFLVTHLIAQFPGFYKSMVTRNPVTNMSTFRIDSHVAEAAEFQGRTATSHSRSAFGDPQQAVAALTRQQRFE